jgi:hypothetical protein
LRATRPRRARSAELEVLPSEPQDGIPLAHMRSAPLATAGGALPSSARRSLRIASSAISRARSRSTRVSSG